MALQEYLQRIERWLQHEDEELAYQADVTADAQAVQEARDRSQEWVCAALPPGTTVRDAAAAWALEEQEVAERTVTVTEHETSLTSLDALYRATVTRWMDVHMAHVRAQQQQWRVSSVDIGDIEPLEEEPDWVETFMPETAVDVRIVEDRTGACPIWMVDDPRGGVVDTPEGIAALLAMLAREVARHYGPTETTAYAVRMAPGWYHYLYEHLLLQHRVHPPMPACLEYHGLRVIPSAQVEDRTLRLEVKDAYALQ